MGSLRAPRRRRRGRRDAIVMVFAAILLGAFSSPSPSPAPPRPRYQYYRFSRLYFIQLGVPASVEARCRLVEDAVVRNPHFDRERVKLQWVASAQPPPAWIVQRGATVTYMDHPAWWRREGEPGAAPRGTAATGRVSSAFLTGRFTVDWPGREEPFLDASVQAFPALGASMKLTGRMIDRSMETPRLQLFVPWNAPCGAGQPRG